MKVLLTLLKERVSRMDVGFTDHALLERTMRWPEALGTTYATGRTVYSSLYNIVETYVRRRDNVPASCDIFMVDPAVACNVRDVLQGQPCKVHVVGVHKLLWTFTSQSDLESVIMIKTFSEARKAMVSHEGNSSNV